MNRVVKKYYPDLYRVGIDMGHDPDIAKKDAYLTQTLPEWTEYAKSDRQYNVKVLLVRLILGDYIQQFNDNHYRKVAESFYYWDVNHPEVIEIIEDLGLI